MAAATWTGGLVVLAAAVMGLRRAGADRSLLQAVARSFGRVSWTAMVVAVATGILQVVWMGISWSYPRLHIKLGLVVSVIAMAIFHQVTARRASPRSRGMIQAAILLVSAAVFAAAVAL